MTCPSTFEAPSPDGTSILAAEAIQVDAELWPLETGKHEAITGDLVILRSRVDGKPDVCGAFTRLRLADTDDWHAVTGEFPPEDAARWREHFTGIAVPSQRLRHWLSELTEQARTAALAGSIQAAADADHARAPRCTWCGRAGRPYEYKKVRFDGLTSFKGERLCPACRDEMSAAEGVQVLVDPGSLRIPYVVTIGRPQDADSVIIQAQFGDGRDRPRPGRQRKRARKNGS